MHHARRRRQAVSAVLAGQALARCVRAAGTRAPHVPRMSRSEQTWCAAMKIELEISDVFVREAEMLAERLSSDREHVTRDDVLVLAIGSGQEPRSMSPFRCI